MKNRFEKLLITSALLIGGFIVSIPFIWMILSSFKSEREARTMPPTFWPQEFTFEHYINLFQNLNFGTYFTNTLIIVLFAMLGLLFNTMAGYGFAKFQFKGKEAVFIAVLATMMIPAQVSMIPVYLLLNQMGLTNTMSGIILPGLIAAFNIFLIRQFMTTIPNDLIESARIDGAKEFRIFFQIIIPLSKPVLAVQAILTFVGAWNSFLWPLIVANDQALYTLSVGLALLQGQHSSSFALQMAGATVMVIPVLILFIFVQRYIVEGFNTTGIK
ncbi:carbohydrate ABC transporter permease [Salipaludibacillus sp. CUR1]|uniref:carbohydrate ABC transporter permease n=1 Tax=Salipaludibacillus sp. CUR1 TaxID=2820003 RepID=UPI001E5CD191|nr:carbohydrate ABC transporter permease [Salipaludibacillus sp. CUR1]